MAMTHEEAEAKFTEAAAAYGDGQYQHAADLFGELFLEPEVLQFTNEMHWNYAMCLVHLDNWPLALQHVQAGGYAEHDFREACRHADVHDAQHDYEQADALYQAGQYREACDAFAGLLLHPGYSADQVRLMHWNMAMCFAHLDDFPAALEHIQAGQWSEDDFREATRASNLRDAQHEFQRADELYRAGRYGEACELFADLLLQPGYPADQLTLMNWNMAMCFAHMDQWDTAFAHIQAGHFNEADFRHQCEESGLHPPAAAPS